ASTAGSSGVGGGRPDPKTVVWTQQSMNASYPRSVGYTELRFDPVSARTWVYVGHPSMTGMVNVTQGATAVTRASGETFGTGWAPIDGDVLSLGGVSYGIAAGSVVPPDQLNLTTPYNGGSGAVAFSAGPSTIYSTDVYFYDSDDHTFTYALGN